ncbi:MAG TPA: response regulator [Candidatus Acidoferrum sp.]|nr:response regulator [Candidatus Acidoferrum sp.]
MAKRILFVDDEPLMLSALERSLFLLRPEWEMSFVKGGQEALQAMGKERYDVIVTDIRMPGMSGVQLLEKVKERYPDCLRFVLSGQADKQTILNTVSPAHQFLSKPCKAEELKRRLAGAFAVRSFMGKAGLREVVSKLGSLPSLPTLFVELTNEINSGDPRMARIANLVSRDMGMTAKILQLVNSSFFGLRTQVSSPSNAVQLLGLDILRAGAFHTRVQQVPNGHSGRRGHRALVGTQPCGGRVCETNRADGDVGTTCGGRLFYGGLAARCGETGTGLVGASEICGCAASSEGERTIFRDGRNGGPGMYARGCRSVPAGIVGIARQHN